MPFNIVSILAVVVLRLCQKCKGVIKKATKRHESDVENETDGPCLKREAYKEKEKAQEDKFDEVS